MNLSNGEKLILMMLADIYEKLGIDDGFDPEFVRSAVTNDQAWGFSWRYPGIPFENIEEPAVVKEVLDILDMWSFIEYGYEQLNDSQKEKLLVDLDQTESFVRFGGFDYNNNSEHVSAMNFIINDLDRYTEFKGRYLNTHTMTSLPRYREMLEVFKSVRERMELGLNGLSYNNLHALLDPKN